MSTRLRSFNGVWSTLPFYHGETRHATTEERFGSDLYGLSNFDSGYIGRKIFFFQLVCGPCQLCGQLPV